jgi:hypothetical protein
MGRGNASSERDLSDAGATGFQDIHIYSGRLSAVWDLPCQASPCLSPCAKALCIELTPRDVVVEWRDLKLKFNAEMEHPGARSGSVGRKLGLLQRLRPLPSEPDRAERSKATVFQNLHLLFNLASDRSSGDNASPPRRRSARGGQPSSRSETETSRLPSGK